MEQNELNNLIQLCKRNNRTAQGEIYQHFSNKMFGVCRIYSSSYEDAQDLFQEAFIHAFKKINQYQNKGSFEGWLRRIMVNTCLERHRKEKKLQIVRQEEIVEPDENEWFEEVDEIKQSELLSAINELPERYKMVFNLYVLEDYSHQQISKELNIAIGTSKSNLARARTWLQEYLKKKVYREINLQKVTKNETSIG